MFHLRFAEGFTSKSSQHPGELGKLCCHFNREGNWSEPEQTEDWPLHGELAWHPPQPLVSVDGALSYTFEIVFCGWSRWIQRQHHILQTLWEADACVCSIAHLTELSREPSKETTRTYLVLKQKVNRIKAGSRTLVMCGYLQLDFTAGHNSWGVRDLVLVCDFTFVTESTNFQSLGFFKNWILPDSLDSWASFRIWRLGTQGLWDGGACAQGAALSLNLPFVLRLPLRHLRDGVPGDLQLSVGHMWQSDRQVSEISLLPIFRSQVFQQEICFSHRYELISV